MGICPFLAGSAWLGVCFYTNYSRWMMFSDGINGTLKAIPVVD